VSAHRDARMDAPTADGPDPVLAARVAACLPVGAQGYGELLGLLSIESSHAVPSACVTTGARSRLLLNPAFVARHCRSDEHLAMLVLHELHHVLLGHTRLYPRVTPAQNWAFDCLINAQLCRLFPEPRYVGFFGQFAWTARGTARLLGPPRRWRAGGPIPRLAAGAKADPGYGPSRVLLEAAHWRLYDDESVTTEELYRLLARIPGPPGADTAPTLLGNHGPEDADALHPEVLREVRDIVARWPMIDRRSGRDQGGAMARERLTLGARRRAAVAVLRRAIERAAGEPGMGGARRIATVPVEAATPLDDGHDRRAAVQRLLGAEPLLHRGRLLERQRAPMERVAVYLDVSGSMEAVLPALYAALAGCLDKVEPVVRGFSTRIGAISHAQLREGVRLGTGGTEIATVTADLIARRVRRAIIVTDGWVGVIPADHAAALRRCRVRLAVVLTSPGDGAFALRLRLPVFTLPELT
jgi:hypothetical protein